jgi:hypothetical protein
MSKVVPQLGSQKERLAKSLVRLRRAARLSSCKEDIHAVAVELERMVGPTVMRASAARLLGVSQTALDRWISAGDIPTVMTPVGRYEVPLRALVELIEEVDERGGAKNSLASVLRARRLAAA